MEERWENEVRILSHLVLVTFLVLFSGVLIFLNLYEGWEKWMIPIFITFSAVSLFLHISGSLSPGARIYLYSFMLLMELFILISKMNLLMNATPIIMLILVLLAMAQEKKLIWICIGMSFVSYLLRIVFFRDDMGGEGDYVSIGRMIWHLITILLTGSVITRILLMWEKEENAYRERIRELELEKKGTGQFLHKLSQRFLNTIDEIRGLMKTSIENEKSKRIRTRMQIANREGDWLYDKIRDIGDYSRIDMGELQPAKEDYTIESVVSELSCELRHLIRRSVELVFDVDPEVPAVMKSDQLLIRRILWHLIINAMKFTDEGEIYIHIYATPESYGVNLCADVKDTGKGMTKRELGHIRERFYQYEAPESEADSGLGLGIFIVNGFVQALGGFFTLESEVGRGTRAHISIPQEVTDDRPCFVIHNTEKLNVGATFRYEKKTNPGAREYYTLVARNMTKGHPMNTRRIGGIEELRKVLSRTKLTHLVVGEEEYEKEKEYLEGLCGELMLVVVCNEEYEIPEESGAFFLRKPFYCFQVIEVLQGKNKKRRKKPEPVKEEEEFAREEEKSKAAPEGGTAAGEFAVLSEAGVDPAKGLESCMNDTVLYVAMLQEFARDAREKEPELEQFYREKDWENYTIRVHSVKSSSLLIGAESISKLAKMLESASKKEDLQTIEEYYPRFLQEYTRAASLVEQHWPMQEGEKEGGES